MTTRRPPQSEKERERKEMMGAGEADEEFGGGGTVIYLSQVQGDKNCSVGSESLRSAHRQTRSDSASAETTVSQLRTDVSPRLLC